MTTESAGEARVARRPEGQPPLAGHGYECLCPGTFCTEHLTHCRTEADFGLSPYFCAVCYRNRAARVAYAIKRVPPTIPNTVPEDWNA